jgi:hypothetical protein
MIYGSAHIEAELIIQFGRPLRRKWRRSLAGVSESATISEKQQVPRNPKLTAKANLFTISIAEPMKCALPHLDVR